MTATSTSVEAWHELRNSPLLGRQQLEVLRMLRSHGPATAKELFAASHADITLQKRLPELVGLGLVERLDPRACRVTGRSAQVWAAVESFRSHPRNGNGNDRSRNVPERPGTTFQSTREVSPSPRVPAPAEVGRGVFDGATDRRHWADGAGLHSRLAEALQPTKGASPEVSSAALGRKAASPYRDAVCPKCKRLYRGGPWHSPHWVERDGRKLQVDCAGDEVVHV